MQQLIVFDKKISLGTEPNPNQSQLPLLSAFFFFKKKKKTTKKETTAAWLAWIQRTPGTLQPTTGSSV